ncbi:hypothetical protein RI367_000212 [Sorochytrium milnesiophthora]
MEPSFISFHDLSPEGRYLYASPSIKLLLGYEPEELIGRSSYDLFAPTESQNINIVHKDAIAHDKVSVLCLCRLKHKGGYFIQVEIVTNLCSDCIVCATTKASDGRKARARALASEEVWIMGANGQLEAKGWNMRQMACLRAATSNFSECVSAPRQVRACMILNRFTRDLTVMFASNNVRHVLGIEPEAMFGKSLLDFVRADSRRNIMAEVDIVKENESMCHIRFWSNVVTTTGERRERQCEMVVSCGSDGMVCIVREFVPAIYRPAADAAASALAGPSDSQQAISQGSISTATVAGSSSNKPETDAETFSQYTTETGLSSDTSAAAECMGVILWPEIASTLAPAYLDYSVTPVQKRTGEPPSYHSSSSPESTPSSASHPYGDAAQSSAVFRQLQPYPLPAPLPYVSASASRALHDRRALQDRESSVASATTGWSGFDADTEPETSSTAPTSTTSDMDTVTDGGFAPDDDDDDDYASQMDTASH